MSNVVETTVKMGEHHPRGLEQVTIRGEAPVVAEILRTVVAGGDLPAHPMSAKVDFVCKGAGSERWQTAALRSYPIGENIKGGTIDKAKAQSLGIRICEALGLTVTEEP